MDDPGLTMLFVVVASIVTGAFFYEGNRHSIDNAIKAGVLVHGDKAYVLLPTPQR